MKQISKFLFLFVSICFLSSNIFAETLIVSGNYTTPADIFGDLIITNGSININSAGDLLVRGDLKINGGSVFMGPSAGKLRVFGDLIVTNTLPNGDASIIVHDDIEVTGAIITRSLYDDADISTTGASSNGSITAESISTNGYDNAEIYTRGSIEVVGQIATNSSTNDAFIRSLLGSIYAGSITTNASGSGRVRASNSWIRVIGSIVTRGGGGGSAIRAEGFLSAAEIDTLSSGNAYVYTNDFGASVVGTLKTKSTSGYAYVTVDGNLEAGSMILEADDHVNVTVDNSIEVRGDIVMKSETSTGRIESTTGHIYAGSISTNAQGVAYMFSYATPGIVVRRGIQTNSTANQAYVRARTSGDIIASRITTNGDNRSYVESIGMIDVGGAINTRSFGGSSLDSEAYVEASGGDLSAESIFTDGDAESYVSSTGNIDVKDIIKTKSSANVAYVSASNDLSARSIETDGDDSGYVNSTNGNITVAGDIRTNSTSGNTYVKALNGNITARSIKTMGVADDSIQAAAGSGEFQWFPDRTDTAVTIKDSEFYLDKDHTLPTLLSLDGSCTFNGNGHRLELSGSSGLLVKSGSSVLLKNILIDNVVNNSIRCEDDTATLSIRDVIMSQSASTTWSNGSLQIFGHCEIQGAGTGFYYDSSETSTIHQNSTLSIGDGVIFGYIYASARNNFTMVDDTSRFHFDNSTLLALEDVDLLLGTAVFDREVLFQSDSGKTIYFGNGTSADDLALEFHLRSRFDLSGTFTNLP
jgi:hypothetical protein